MIWCLGFVALLSARTFADTVSILDKCDSATNNVCDVTKGLYCENIWTSCVIGRCVCKSGNEWETDKCKKEKKKKNKKTKLPK